MHIPSPANTLTAGLGMSLVKRWGGERISKGEVLDYTVNSCYDHHGHIHCTPPFPVVKGDCVEIHWSTVGTWSQSVAEFRDFASNERVYWRALDGRYEADKDRMLYLDFIPQLSKGRKVEYEVRRCAA